MTISTWPTPSVAHDAIGGWPEGSERVDGFFDRFYFNLHGSQALPFIMVGGGFYPQAGSADGYLIAVVDGQQRNLRFADALTQDSSVGPLGWTVVEPHREWRLRLGENPAGVELDLTWRARSAVWETAPIVLDHPSGTRTRFAHYFQSGRYDGTLTIDGRRRDVAGWMGQRDRSQGVRPLSGGQGLHLWVQAQMPDRTVSLMLDLDRGHRPTMLDGAVLEEGGVGERIVRVEHDLAFTEELEFTTGRLAVETASGRRHVLGVDGSAGGGFLSGGGYGGWHGRHATATVEHERWELDGSVVPRGLDTPLTDRPAVFRAEGGEDAVGAVGIGVFEFAHTRHPGYVYRPAAHDLADVRAVDAGPDI